jgi:signal transduction histidine kinase
MTTPLRLFDAQHRNYESDLESFAARWRITPKKERRTAIASIEGRLTGYFEAMRGHLNELLSVAEAQAAQRMAESESMARRAGQVLVALCLGAGIIALGIAFGMSRHIARPLQSLRKGTFYVAKGDFDHPVSVSGEDELAYLARSFNRMAQQLRSLDRTKDEFFSAISHELRTPLTSVREALQLMLDGIPGPITEEQAKLLSIARDGNDKILRLIDDLLKLSKLEADIMKLNLSPWRIEALIDASVEEIRPIALQSSISLEKDVEERLPMMRLDGVKIQGVLANLLSNAVKFSPAGGTIRIHAALREVPSAENGGAENRLIRVSVADQGTGLVEEDLEKIFDKFYRSANAANRQGAGLGLPIAKRIVESHGGKIWAELPIRNPSPERADLGNQSPGSLFIFEIPVVEAEAENSNRGERGAVAGRLVEINGEGGGVE